MKVLKSLIVALALLPACAWREHAHPTFERQPHIHQAAGKFDWRTREPRRKAAFGVLRSWRADTPHLVRVNRELFAVAELVTHLDKNHNGSLHGILDELQWPTRGFPTDELDRARNMETLAKTTFLNVHRVARIANTGERMDEAQRLTRTAYCQAARIGTPRMTDLPWWRDILIAQQRELRAEGIDAELLDDGRLAATLRAASFDTGSAAIDPTSRDEVRALAERLAARGDVRVLVEGHTDPRPILPDLQARYEDNHALGLARARAVESILVDAGVPADRIRLDSRAATEPPGKGENPRRVELVLEPCS